MYQHLDKSEFAELKGVKRTVPMSYEMIGKTAQPVLTAYHAEHNKVELDRMFR